MGAVRFIEKICISALLFVICPLQAGAAVISFSGQLDVIDFDNGTGVYSDVIAGTTFTGFIDDTAFSGQISDGKTLTTFDSLIAAGGLTVSDNFVLEAEEAATLNAILGATLFSAGDILDGINIEGDAVTAGDGRIEIGLSYLFAADTFDNEDLANYPFDPMDVQLALFFIYEEDADGNDVYSAVGKLNAVPLPPSVWFLGMGIAGLLGIGRKKNRR